MHPFVNNKTKLKTTTSRHRHGAAVAAADLTEPPPYGGGLGDNNNQRTRLFLFECGGDGGVGCGGTAAGEEGEGKTASGASGVDGRVDRVTRKLFEAHRKTPPEKFSGGGAMVAGGGRVAGVVAVEAWRNKDGGEVVAAWGTQMHPPAPLVVRGCDGGGVTVVAAARVRASGYGGWIDPVMGSDFGLGRKCPPEKFSGGGGMVVAAWAVRKELFEIADLEVKKLKRSRIPIVKVRWNSKRGSEFTWEREDQFRSKYPHLFPNASQADRLLKL
ncbi:hypothetical protein Tco_1539572 [Tanacetum coccineum]